MNAAGHFRCLFRKSVMAECTGGKPHKVEDVSVLADEPAIGLCLIRFMLGYETAEPIRDIVRKPGAAELFVGTQSPHSELAHVDLHTVLKGKEDICEAAVLEYGDILKFAAVFQNTLIGEQTVDAVEPLLRIAAAALQNKPFIAVHTAKVVGGYGFDAHITFLPSAWIHLGFLPRQIPILSSFRPGSSARCPHPAEYIRFRRNRECPSLKQCRRG